MSLFVVPWTALYAEFSDDYAERTTIVTWRFAIGWIGTLAFVVTTWRYIFASTPSLLQSRPASIPTPTPCSRP